MNGAVAAACAELGKRNGLRTAGGHHGRFSVSPAELFEAGWVRRGAVGFGRALGIGLGLGLGLVLSRATVRRVLLGLEYRWRRPKADNQGTIPTPRT